MSQIYNLLLDEECVCDTMIFSAMNKKVEKSCPQYPKQLVEVGREGIFICTAFANGRCMHGEARKPLPACTQKAERPPVKRRLPSFHH